MHGTLSLYSGTTSGFIKCSKLVYVPNTNPSSPNIRMNKSFHSIHLYFPRPSGQNVTISIIGGKMSANAEELTAPTSEMMPPRFGMMQAKRTVKRDLVN